MNSGYSNNFNQYSSNRNVAGTREFLDSRNLEHYPEGPLSS